MKTTIKYIAPWLAAAAIGGAIALAPIASAEADPSVPLNAPDSTSPYVLGHHTSNHDEANTLNGYVDVPFGDATSRRPAGLAFRLTGFGG